MEEKGSSNEENDEDYHAPCWELVFILLSVCITLFDTITDVILATDYFLHEQWIFGSLTLFCILLPLIIIGIFYSFWCCQDYGVSARPSCIFCCSNAIFLLLGLAPVHRYLHSMVFWCKCRRAEKNGQQREQREYYQLLTQSDTETAFLSFSERFMHSAPQLCLQFSLVMRSCINEQPNDLMQHVTLYQLLSIVASLVSIIWSLAKYECQQLSYNWQFCSIFLPTMWKLLITVSRITLLGALASVSLLYSGLICAIHVIIMTLWLMVCVKIDARSIHLALIYIFVYIPTKTASLGAFYCIYYSTITFENATMLVGFWLLAPTQPSYFVPVLILASSTYLAGMVLKLLYYTCCHPKTRKICKTSEALT